MALKDYAKPRAQRAAIQDRLNAAVEQIRNTPGLTPQYRLAEIAKAALAARNDAAAAQAELVAARASRRQQLERQLFGIVGEPSATELMVMRDSRDRADQIGSDAEAQSKLQLASQAGDMFMARAIAQVARARGWSDALNAFAESAPASFQDALEELNAIPAGEKTTMADAAAFHVQMPEELRSFIGPGDDRNLQSLAEGADRVLVTDSATREMEWKAVR